ncbi:MAG: class I tRNA ligase family protein [Candidatus Bathyarchaeia archaeon]
MFREVGPKVDLPKLEREILRFWAEGKIFDKLRALRRGSPPWSFIDGPITANNPMGVHHAWGRTYKDLFQRYKAMRGFELRYQNGFDCQGLWIEVEVEKELGFKSKREIEAYGIDEFVKRCKQRVLRYAANIVEQSIRLGYWMEWDDPETLRKLADKLEGPSELIEVKGPQSGILSGTVEQVVGMLGAPGFGGSYFTFSDENNYSIWMVLKKCHEKGWIYKGRDVMPWCPRCSTALSEHEIATEGYRELTHLALTVRFPIKGRPGESLLIWTTTPWTLSSNVAAAVHPDITYVRARKGEETFILAKAALERTLKDGYEILEEIRGSNLEGIAYEGPFDELPAVKEAGVPDAHAVILWEGVSESEGTGIVHIAPGCGKEDFELGIQERLPILAPLDEFGVFQKGFSWLTGKTAQEVAKPVVEELQRKGLLLKAEDYVHRYPVCWRCGSELVFRLVDEWFISMGEKLPKPLDLLSEEEVAKNLRYQIMRSAKEVRWIPEYGLQQELDWLSNMGDWMISKKRYWGLALPIWECKACGHFEVIGSKEELKEKAIEGWEVFEGHTPHRPWIDAVKIKCPRCGEKVSRIPDVGNPWLDAGIVAFSTLNYRHDRSYWKRWFPADFICESLPGQFRNWFYSMLAMSTILEGRAPFRTCLGHGLVLAEDGREMHKSWGNVIWFDEAVERMGADVMRWIYCTSRPEGNILFGYKKAEEVRRDFIIPLWNVYSFFVTYARLDRWQPHKGEYQRTSLDRWILSKLQILIKNVTKALEDFDVYTAAFRIQEFVEDLSTWYVRRSRRRFWKSEESLDKNAGYETLYECLVTLSRLLAPFLPFLSEEIYQNLVRSVDPKAPESVHLNDWPIPDESKIDYKILEDMELAIRVASLGRSARNKAGIKLRQPLEKALVVAEPSKIEALRPLSELVKDELNVKEIAFVGREALFEYELKGRSEILGAKYGSLFPKINEALASKASEALPHILRGGNPATLEVNGKVITLLPEEVEVLEIPRKDYSVSEDEESEILVGVYTKISEELEAEGLAREIVRRVQDQRKEAGFHIADYIRLYYKAGPKLTRVFETWGGYIASETLALSLEKGEPPEGSHMATFRLKDEELRIGLIRIHALSPKEGCPPS